MLHTDSSYLCIFFYNQAPFCYTCQCAPSNVHTHHVRYFLSYCLCLTIMGQKPRGISPAQVLSKQLQDLRCHHLSLEGKGMLHFILNQFCTDNTHAPDCVLRSLQRNVPPSCPQPAIPTRTPMHTVLLFEEIFHEYKLFSALLAQPDEISEFSLFRI